MRHIVYREAFQTPLHVRNGAHMHGKTAKAVYNLDAPFDNSIIDDF